MFNLFLYNDTIQKKNEYVLFHKKSFCRKMKRLLFKKTKIKETVAQSGYV